ncbi:GNAT family N-acetyltransferase [Paenibacillus sp. Marseille-Q4541]|uniref:GNAT family N-acetyltransferase n=1 Tax=Paenibacillus sp. Marseille-Q4541 TaxID=2831522 RepID=UPI001BA9B75B
MVTRQALTVRKSVLQDAAQLMELDALVWDEHNAPAPVLWTSTEQYLLSSPPGNQLIALDHTNLCGYIGFKSPTPLHSNNHVLEIHIAVHPAYQKQGVGTSLMDSMIKYARSQGIRKLRLRVLSSNLSALAFYKKCGFVEEGRLQSEFYISGQFVDDILMRYML